MVYMYIAYKYV